MERLEQIEDAGIEEGDKIEVKLIDIDPGAASSSSLGRCCSQNQKGQRGIFKA